MVVPFKLLMFSYENTSLLAWKFSGRIYPHLISLLMNDGASCPSKSVALVKWMSTCCISIMFIRTNINTLGEIWPKVLQTIRFLTFNSPWKSDPWLHPGWKVSLKISWLQGEMTMHLTFVFQHCLRSYMSPKSSSPSTVSLLRCIWCLDSSDLFCLFSRWSCIYLWLLHWKDVRKQSALTTCRFLVHLHLFLFFPFCWSCKISWLIYCLIIQPLTCHSSLAMLAIGSLLTSHVCLLLPWVRCVLFSRYILCSGSCRIPPPITFGGLISVGLSSWFLRCISPCINLLGLKFIYTPSLSRSVQLFLFLVLLWPFSLVSSQTVGSASSLAFNVLYWLKL